MNLKELVASDATLKEFLLIYARQHYGLMDGQDRVKLSKGCVEDMEMAQVELNELISMSNEEKQERTDAFNENLKKLDEESVDKDAPSEESINRMADLIDSYEAEVSTELDFILNNASTYLSSLIQVTPSSVLGPRTVDEWHDEQIEIANRRLQWTIRAFSEAQSDVEDANAALDAIEEL